MHLHSSVSMNCACGVEGITDLKINSAIALIISCFALGLFLLSFHQPMLFHIGMEISTSDFFMEFRIIMNELLVSQSCEHPPNSSKSLQDENNTTIYSVVFIFTQQFVLGLCVVVCCNKIICKLLSSN